MENRTAGEAGEETGTCVIIGAGELTVERIPVRDGDFVIAADGGYAYSRRLGLEPDLILGDLILWMRKTGDRLKPSGRSARSGYRSFP